MSMFRITKHESDAAMQRRQIPAPATTAVAAQFAFKKPKLN